MILIIIDTRILNMCYVVDFISQDGTHIPGTGKEFIVHNFVG